MLRGSELETQRKFVLCSKLEARRQFALCNKFEAQGQFVLCSKLQAQRQFALCSKLRWVPAEPAPCRCFLYSAGQPKQPLCHCFSMLQNHLWWSRWCVHLQRTGSVVIVGLLKENHLLRFCGPIRMNFIDLLILWRQIVTKNWTPTITTLSIGSVVTVGLQRENIRCDFAAQFE